MAPTLAHLCVTRQNVMAIGPGAGKARVTRQSIQVLGPNNVITEIEVADYLSPAHMALGYNGTHHESAIDTLNCLHVATVVHWQFQCIDTLNCLHAATVIYAPYIQVATDVLTSIHEAVAVYWPRQDVSDTISDTHTATVIYWPCQQVANTLACTHMATVTRVRQVHVASILSLTDSVKSGIKIGIATDVLQTITYQYDSGTGESIPYYFGLRDVATRIIVRAAPYILSHTISFSQRAIGIVVHADAIAVTATDTLNLTHAAYANKAPIVIHTLVLTDLATVVLAKAISDTLVLTVTATVNVFRATLAVVDTLVLGQSVAVIGGVSSATLCQYHPFVGEGASGNPTPPPTALSGPMSGIEVPFQLVYPAEGEVTDSVTLRAPELGNKDRLSFNRVIRETRGGTLVVFADPMWPKIQTLVLSFIGLRRTEAQDLLDFFDDYLGLEIGMIDWEQRYWVGIIMTPEEPIIEDDFNSYSVKFEFEGELDPTWMPQVIPYSPGTPLRRTRSDLRSGLESVEESTPLEIPADSYYAQADAAMSAGQVLYIVTDGHGALARANAAVTAGAVGLVFADVGIGETACYITEGHITLADWTAVIGAVSLIPGSNYFLSTSAAGKITATAPTTLGEYVVRIGRATSATTLDVEIELPIRL